MMKTLTIASETILLLRRDRVFLPVMIAMALLSGFANLASDWGVFEHRKILFDIGCASFHFTGCIVAIFWGAKLVSDTRTDGSLELQLAAPISRTNLLIGRYLGLAGTLIFIAVLMLILWQAVVWNAGMRWMSPPEFGIMALFTVSWLVVGAIAILMGSFATQATALFSSLTIWILGLLSPTFLLAIQESTPESTRKMVQGFAFIWNFQRFNLSELIDVVPVTEFIPLSDLLHRLAYAAGIILLSLSIGAFAFNKKDVTG